MEGAVGEEGVADGGRIAQRLRVPVPRDIGRRLPAHVAGHLQLLANLTQGLQVQPSFEVWFFCIKKKQISLGYTRQH
jgi:hypothetical protein